MSGDVWLTVADHLPWDEQERDHLLLLQDKLNAYLRFIESGEVLASYPSAEGRKIVINIVGKFPLSSAAESFVERARTEIEAAGYGLQTSILAA